MLRNKTVLFWTFCPKKKKVNKSFKITIVIFQNRQKSYADLKREIEHQAGGKVLLKVSPWKKIMRFGQKGKLRP